RQCNVSIERNTNGLTCISIGSTECLPDPPCSMSGKPVTTAPIVTLYCADQANIPLLDKIEQGKTTSNVAFGNAYYQAQIRQNELLHCLAIAHFDALRKIDFTFVCNHGHAPNLTKVRHYRI